MPVHTHPSITRTIPLAETLLNIPRTCVQKTRGIRLTVLLLLMCAFLQGVGGAHTCTYPSRHSPDYSFRQNHLEYA